MTTEPIPNHPDQASLFTDDLRAIRDDAIDRADRHADQDWRTKADWAVHRAAQDWDLFTADDARTLLEATWPGTTTHDNRAWGPVMQAAHRAGLIEPTDRFRPSKRASSHMGPQRLWRSLLDGDA